MAVYKEEKTNTWRVLYRYTDWNGERKQSQKRGFKTKREAQAWEREQLNKLGGDLDMNFKSFVQHYTEDMQSRIKENTWATKEHIIQTKLMPYFGKLKMSNITAQQIITWQNELINYKDNNGKPYSPVYLKTIHNQLSAIFNHAVRYYNLKENPCQKAGSMGKKKNREMLFWTKEEYLKFADVMMDTETKEKKTSSRPRKQRQKVDSPYSTINCDDLNLAQYPEVKSLKNFKEKMMLILYIITNEGKGEWFTTADILCLMTDIFGESATKKQVEGVFKREKRWFKCENIKGSNKFIHRKLLNEGKSYAQSLTVATE